MKPLNGSGGWGTTPDSHWTMKRSAAALGIVAQLGMGFGPAMATDGATLPGVPTTPVTTVPDSVGGVTQATSANKAMSCGSGMVLSGGVCVPLPTPTVVPECAYGTVWSGGSCVPIGSMTPPPVSCPSGQVLSGGVCVPLPTPPTTCPATTPANTQYLTCSSGQTGSIVQTRTVTCDASTGYAWTTGTWATASNSCTSSPAPVPTPSACTASYQSWGAACYGYTSGAASGYQSSATNTNSSYTGTAYFTCTNGSWSYSSGSCNPVPAPVQCAPNYGPTSWGGPSGNSCSGYVAAGSTPAGGSYTVTSTNGTPGSYTLNCSSSGSWVPGSQSCTVAPPPQCSAVAGPVGWGTCTGYVNAPNTPVGGSYSISATGGGTGSISWSCGSGPQWVETNRSCTPNYTPPPSVGCAAQAISWGSYAQARCVGQTPALANGQTANVGAIVSGWGSSTGTATVQCYNGSISIVSDPYGNCYGGF